MQEQITRHIKILMLSINLGILYSKLNINYYSWYIGLDNEYPFSNSVNGYYGMQFSVGRTETNPKLSIRRKEKIMFGKD